MTLPPEQKLTTAALKPVDPPFHLTLSLLTNIPPVAPASVSPSPHTTTLTAVIHSLSQFIPGSLPLEQNAPLCLILITPPPC